MTSTRFTRILINNKHHILSTKCSNIAVAGENMTDNNGTEMNNIEKYRLNDAEHNDRYIEIGFYPLI